MALGSLTVGIPRRQDAGLGGPRADPLVFGSAAPQPSLDLWGFGFSTSGLHDGENELDLAVLTSESRLSLGLSNGQAQEGHLWQMEALLMSEPSKHELCLQICLGAAYQAQPLHLLGLVEAASTSQPSLTKSRCQQGHPCLQECLSCATPLLKALLFETGFAAGPLHLPLSQLHLDALNLEA